MSMYVDRAVGIDLGTTNSEIALLDPSERDLLVYEDRFGRRTFSSAVAWDPREERVLVGRDARKRRGREPAPIESIKRKMGTAAKVRIGAEEMTPEEVSAILLSALRDRMRAFLQAKTEEAEVRVTRAVITVPAYFDAPQVEATRAAGERAGLEVLGVLQEPTAAAIYHTWKRKLGDGCFLVYDLGGGTFDVSVLRCLSGEYQVLAIDGDNYLGGDDFDRRFAEHLRRRLTQRGYALDLDPAGDTEDAARFARLVHLAQAIKESLSTQEVVSVNEHDLMTDKKGEVVDLDEEIGRAEYAEVIADLVETTIERCRRALAESTAQAGVSLADIDHVVLVGGSTRVPHVVERVVEALCQPSRCASPLQDEVDTCVALGAAIHAAQRGGLEVGDGGLQIKVSSPLVGTGDSIPLALQVAKAPTDAHRVAVFDNEEVLAEAELDEERRARVTVPLGEAEARLVSLRVFDESGEPGGEVPLALYRGDVRPRASALSRPSVLPKDISVEVLRAGRRERRVLLRRGTGLPTEAKHTFATADRSGAVVLRLLQDRLLIKTLMLPIDPETAVGSPVELTLRCDEAMRLEAQATVAGQELWATLEPARREVPGTEQVEALLGRAEEASRALWGHDAHYYRREIDPLVTGIREVLGTDPDKLGALCAKLESMLDYYGSAPDGMNPPWNRFEHTLDALRRTIFRARGELMGIDPRGWELRINDLAERGRSAWEEAEPSAWRRTYDEAQALLETAGEHEFSQMKLDDPEYVRRRLQGARARAQRVQHGLVDFIPSSTVEVRQLQLAERDRLSVLLRDRVTGPLAALKLENAGELDRLRREIADISAELDRIHKALQRLPALGVVNERTRG